MRNLAPTSLWVARTSEDERQHSANLAVDPESGDVLLALERKLEEGSVEVEIARLPAQSGSQTGPEILGSFTSPVLAPFPIPDYASQTLDVHFFPDDRVLVILLYGGDIATVHIEGDGQAGPVEIVGSIDSGIKGAAWSPDEEQLILVTGEDNLVCMTRNFDTLHEEPLRSDEFGEDAFINVGWGSKTTQFHGSLGKAAAKATAVSSSLSRAHDTDHGLPSISFRGDAAFFAVSSLDSHPHQPDVARRQIRIYSRDASAGFVPKLSATSEALPGLEPSVAWRPSGNLLSGLVRYGYEGGGEGREGRWDVAMLERNGLRHGGFELREEKAVWREGRVRGLAWNADSEVLAIWVERNDEDIVQLWTMKNYHYYLKQEIAPHDAKRSRLRGMRWHPEDPLRLYTWNDHSVAVRSYIWYTYASQLPMPIDTATVAVVDGKSLLITPFRTQNVPPPMSSFTISLPSTPLHLSMSPITDSLAVLLSDGSIQVWDLNTRLPEASKGSALKRGGKVAQPKMRWCNSRGLAGSMPRQVALAPDKSAAVLRRNVATGHQEVVIARTEDAELEVSILEGQAERLLWSEHGWLVLDNQGTLKSVLGPQVLDIDLCPNPTTLSISHSSNLIFALSSSGKLFLAPLTAHGSSTSLASSVTSFTLTPDFLIYTTSAQSSFYAPLPTLARLAEGDHLAASETDWETRRVERGALAVVACPSSMSLVLQMPRGNLETVYPRALVLAVVRRNILACDYRSAFVTCRKHRLDLNVLYDLDSQAFLANLSKVLDQIPEVDYLNLLISSLNDTDISLTYYRDLRKPSSSSFSPSSSKINTICTAIRDQLMVRDMVKYVDTILTTHVCQQPADYESGLRLLLQLQVGHPEIVEDAIKYIIFLSDVNKLYDVALGMYDFKLVLMVAQYSQKDPKEYLPFLRELKALDKWEQRFRIDSHLGRHNSALRNLYRCGADKFEEAASYLAKYELYDEGFKLYKDDESHLPIIQELYGDYLFDRREWYDAALSYVLAGKPAKALASYERAHAWRELFALAQRQNTAPEEMRKLVENVTDALSHRGQSIEAAQVFMQYGDDVESAVDVLSRGGEFAEAHRLIVLRHRPELVATHVEPALGSAQADTLDAFEEMQGQLEKELLRLGQLRKIREEDTDTFYIVDNEPALEGVDVATNATTQASAFTRYTVAPTTVFSQTSRVTGQTNKSRHQRSRRAAGRKGTVDEYEYLLASLGRLLVRVDGKSDEALTLLRYLVTGPAELRGAAHELQMTIVGFRQLLARSLTDAWSDRVDVLEGVTESGGMGLLDKLEEAKALEKPVVREWKGLGPLVGHDQR